MKGKSKAEAQALFEKFHRMVTGEVRASVDPLELDDFEVFAGVRAFPVRVKCASLAWHTLRAALAEGEKTVSTD